MNGRPDLTEQLQRLHRIGIALSSERSLDRLLEMIVEEARRLTGADGGTLYLVSGDSLEFRIVQTGTLGVRMGGPSGAPIAWPPVPLKVDGRPNEAHVCAWAAVHGRTANIPDVYEAEGYDFRGTRAFDAAGGYRSRSMLVVPMRDHVSVTMRLLDQIPFPNKLKGVPRCAGGHHERLNGKGYPLGLTADDLPLQTRMLAIADVYEALTADDRSYKRPRTHDEAVRILRFMVQDGELDGDLVELFVRSGAWKAGNNPQP